MTSNSLLIKLFLIAIIKEKEKASQLEKAQQQIRTQEKLAYLGLLMAGIIHEIKNPLSLAQNFAELSLQEIELELQSNLEPNESILIIAECLESIKNQTSRIQEIIYNMFQANSDRESAKPTDLNDLVLKAYKLVYYSKNFDETPEKLRIETDFDKTIQPVPVIAREIIQVLINLINNAYDAILAKQLHLEDYAPVIKLATKNLAQFVEIIIEDNGEGIPSDVIDKIFQPFFTTKASGKGTGLGLAIANDLIVSKYGGSLTVETEQGKFSRFFIKLPKNKEQQR